MNIRVDQPKPSSHAGLRALRDNCRRLRSPRNDPPHAQATDEPKYLYMNQFFPDRLLDPKLIS
jgi:hypothetical protein